MKFVLSRIGIYASCVLTSRARFAVTRVAITALLLFSTGYAQVQPNGAIALTGSVQLVAEGTHSIALRWSGTKDQDISFRVYRSTTSSSNYKLVQSLVKCPH